MVYIAKINEYYGDIILRANDGKTIKSSKFILESRWPYFRRLKNSSMSDSNTSLLELDIFYNILKINNNFGYII